MRRDGVIEPPFKLAVIPMKIGLALIRKEADLYRSQGLHGEALGLYAKYIARSANIDPGTKSSIKKQIQAYRVGNELR